MGMYNSKTFIYYLDNAESFGKSVPVDGNIIQLVDASSSAASVEIEATGTNLQGSGYLPFKERDKLAVPDPFNRINLRWEAQAGAWVKVLVVTIDPAPERFEFTQEQRGTIDEISTPVQIESANTGADDKKTIGAASAELVPADTTRKVALIRNYHASNTLFVGETPATTNMFPVLAGETYTHTSTSALYGIASAASTDVRVRIEKAV